MSDEPITEPVDPVSIFPYSVEVAGLGLCTVLKPEGVSGYRVQLPSGEVQTFLSASGNPSPEVASEEIANPPAPLPVVPSEVPAWRLHAVAEIAGLSGAIGTALSSLTGSAKIVASAAWYQGNTIERNSAKVVALGAALGLMPQALDELFIQAASLQV